MKINEIFSSIQGEGAYAGHPVTFVRTSGCTRKCDFCDTKYHTNGKTMSTDAIVEQIKNKGLETIVWTGGEPLLQINGIFRVMEKLKGYKNHLETNGDINIGINFNHFDYVCISPKDLKSTKKVSKYKIATQKDIKVVTDLTLNKELISYATMLMPLSTGNKEIDLKTEQTLWNYCVENNFKFTLRQHTHVWDLNDRGV